MEKAAKLSQSLSTNIPLVLSIKKRGPSYPETDYNTKEPTGRMVYMYIFGDDRNNEYIHYANELQEETLKSFNAGELVQVVRQESLNERTNKRISYLVFTAPEGAEARSAATPQLVSNTAVTRHDNAEKARKDKEYQICCQGFAQALIVRGTLTDMEVREKAIEFASWIRSLSSPQ